MPTSKVVGENARYQRREYRHDELVRVFAPRSVFPAGTQFTCFAGTKVPVLTHAYSLLVLCFFFFAAPRPPRAALCESKGTQFCLLYWCKSTNTDTAALCESKDPSCCRQEVVAPQSGTQFTCFTGTKAQILTQEGAATQSVFSVFLLYWYKSTNAGKGRALRIRRQSQRCCAIFPPVLLHLDHELRRFFSPPCFTTPRFFRFTLRFSPLFYNTSITN
jgi:hypothetical protein